MTELATTRAAPPAQRPRGQAQNLAALEQAYIAPISTVPGASVWKDLRYLLDLEGTALERWRASRRALEMAPSAAELKAYIDTTAPAIDQPIDPNKARIMVGMLLAAYPNGKPADFDAYADTLLHDVLSMGFSAHVLAKACQAIRREVRFLPCNAEVVAACKAAKDEISGARWLATQLLQHVERAERVAALPEPEPVAWDLRRADEAAKAISKPQPAQPLPRLPASANPVDAMTKRTERMVGFV